jgi:peptidoglycan/xylan/chitin deacetylase (PgdA/CDA1 family)
LTKSILDILKTNNIKATFFVLGRQVNMGELLAAVTRQAFDDGHQIALHTWDHSSLLYLTSTELNAQIDSNICAVYNTIGKIPNYFRAPYGETNVSILTLLKQRRLKVAYWNVDSEDWSLWQHGKTADELYNNFVKLVDNRGKQLISLNHDKFDLTVQALPRMIAYVRSKGLDIQTLAECMGDSMPYVSESRIHYFAPNSTTA